MGNLMQSDFMRGFLCGFGFGIFFFLIRFIMHANGKLEEIRKEIWILLFFFEKDGKLDTYLIRNLMSRIWDVRFFLKCDDFYNAMRSCRELHSFSLGNYSQCLKEKRDQDINDLRNFREHGIPSSLLTFIRHPFRFIAWMFRFKIEEYDQL